MAAFERLEIAARGLTFPALATGEGDLVLCLHGFPDDLHSFAHQLPALAAAGFRAVAPALRGYAPGCTPSRTGCNPLEVARDAVAIVHALGARRAHLVGHDWGAVAAYLAAALAPSTWISVTTLAVPHPVGLLRTLWRVPRQLTCSWYMLFFQLPGAEQAFRARDYALLEQLWRSWSPGFRPHAADLERVKATFRQPGVTHAALSYYRNLLAPGSDSTREAWRLLAGARLAAPFLALTGADDGCIDTRTYDHAMRPRDFTELELERVPGAGHFLHMESPEHVNPRIVAWLRERRTRETV